MEEIKNMENVAVTTWEEYRTAAMRTCTAESRNKEYMLLGLMGEAGEVANKVKKIIRDDHGRLTHERSLQILAELGDVMWYVAGLCTVLDTTPEDCKDFPKLAELQKYIEEPANAICDGSIDSYTEKTLYLAEVVSDCVTAAHFEHFDSTVIAYVIEAVAVLGQKIGYTVQQICQHNIDKLTDRYNRSVIGGSGDER